MYVGPPSALLLRSEMAPSALLLLRFFFGDVAVGPDVGLLVVWAFEQLLWCTMCVVVGLVSVLLSVRVAPARLFKRASFPARSAFFFNGLRARRAARDFFGLTVVGRLKYHLRLSETFVRRLK